MREDLRPASSIPSLFMLALKEVVSTPSIIKERKKDFLISFGLTGGLALLFAIFPKVFFPNYVSTMEMNALQSIPTDQLVPLLANLEEVRMSLFTSDALRSFFIILIGVNLILAYGMGKLKQNVLMAALAVLCLVDMWGVNKRYLNDNMFVQPRPQAQDFPTSPADEQILQDKDAYHRVLNLTVSTFNDNTTSYHHKSIGGYHAAKLRRYQELIEEHLQKEMRQAQMTAITNGFRLDSICTDSIFPVLNMLNMKYMILAGKDNAKTPVLNPGANGNAWMVDNIEYVADADAEIKALHGMDTKHSAVADKKFENVLGKAVPGSKGHIKLTQYAANELAYEVDSEKGGIAVFSEIYYPEGWKAWIEPAGAYGTVRGGHYQPTGEGRQIDLFRADWMLRGAIIPEGEGELIMRFEPESYQVGENISRASSILLILLLLASVAGAVIQDQRVRNS